MATVNTHHPDYDKMIDRWVTCEDVADGQAAIHAKGTRYLPKLKEEKDDDYKARKCRALFYNATWRTIAGLQGLLFRKQPVINSSSIMDSMIDDITLDGQSLYDFAYDLSEDALEVGRVGVLVDRAMQSTEGMTEAEVAKLNLRPYLKEYDAKSIINWRKSVINGINKLSLVVLLESEEIQENEFKTVSEPRYKVLDMINGVYRQRLFMIDDKDQDVLLSESYPVINGQFFDYIPFVCIGADCVGIDVESPPLEDLVFTNLSHYNVTADYEHGCHYTGLPTAVISGYTKQDADEKLYIGSPAAWVFSDPQSKASFLEFTGQGLTALENNLRSKEQMMAVLGARMLSSDKKGIEAADTAAIHRSGENSILSGISRNISSGLSWALSVMEQWAGGGGDVSIEMNKEFLGKVITGQELTALVGSWQSGAISQETLFLNLKRGEIYPDNVEFEEEQAKIDSTPVITIV